jgi:nicotinate-nucleotide pyrophosphorylase (carboxylating)
MFVPRRLVEEKLKQLLADDVGQGDVTAAAVIPGGLTVNAEVIAKEDGVVAGIEEAAFLAEYLGLTVKVKVAEGEKIKNKQVLMQISGDAQTILSVERTLLNLLSRMSGIATKTQTLTEKLKKANSKARIAATRKSPPGLLYFDKKAVVIGGGDPHRLHLDDMVLIKDNHLAIIGNVEEAVKKAKTQASFSKKIEVEVTTIEDALKAAKAALTLLCWIIFLLIKPKLPQKHLGKLGLAAYCLKSAVESLAITCWSMRKRKWTS